MTVESGRSALQHYLVDLLTPETVVVESVPDLAQPPLGLADRPSSTPLPRIAGSKAVANPRPKIEDLAAPLPPTKLAEADIARLQALLDHQFTIAPAVPLETAAVSVPFVEREVVAKVSTPPKPAAPLVPEPLLEPQAALQPSKTVEPARPAWATGQFDVLLLKVSGLSIAVPLVALGHIYPITRALNHIPGQAAWFMGLLRVGDLAVRTLNTAMFVMPERYTPDFLDTAKYVVTLDTLPWGLAVDEVEQPISIAADDVTWRQQRSKRPWLAGTVKSQMCALLDIPEMAKLLIASEPSVCC